MNTPEYFVLPRYFWNLANFKQSNHNTWFCTGMMMDGGKHAQLQGIRNLSYGVLNVRENGQQVLPGLGQILCVCWFVRQTDLCLLGCWSVCLFDFRRARLADLVDLTNAKILKFDHITDIIQDRTTMQGMLNNFRIHIKNESSEFEKKLLTVPLTQPKCANKERNVSK